MNYWHMQLHPSSSDPIDRKQTAEILTKYGVIGMGESWKNDRGQPRIFKEEMAIDDVVLIRSKGSPLALVAVVGDTERNSQASVWFPITRKINIIALDESGDIKHEYKKATGDNWTKGIYAPATLGSANNWAFFQYWYDKVS